MQRYMLRGEAEAQLKHTEARLKRAGARLKHSASTDDAGEDVKRPDPLLFADSLANELGDDDALAMGAAVAAAPFAPVGVGIRFGHLCWLSPHVHPVVIGAH